MDSDSPPRCARTDALQVVRRCVLVILMIGMAGTAVELLLLQHDEGTIQLIPLALLGTGLMVVAWDGARPAAASAMAVRAVMAAFVAAGVAGVYFHFRANVEFQLEGDPSLAGVSLLWQVLGAKVPPALAPGIMVQLGLLGLTYTYTHKEQ